MGLFNKLAFWKRDDHRIEEIADREIMGKSDFLQDLTPESDVGMNEPPFSEATGSESFSGRTSTKSISPFPATTTPPTFSTDRDRELELINSKLDTLKVMLNSIEQRISNLERNATEPKQPTRLW
ncbi:hypothetical protein HZC32_03290 [Candidatus Woesearchaeota archaeon]|nr:hypothetical protein [Candidatus Woesearchaeota archaeon]